MVQHLWCLPCPHLVIIPQLKGQVATLHQSFRHTMCYVCCMYHLAPPDKHGMGQEGWPNQHQCCSKSSCTYPDLTHAGLQAWIYAIEQSCLNKAAVVAADEREGGVRATLNLGHTFGHAIETGQGYGMSSALCCHSSDMCMNRLTKPACAHKACLRNRIKRDYMARLIYGMPLLRCEKMAKDEASSLHTCGLPYAPPLPLLMGQFVELGYPSYPSEKQK